MPAMFLLHSDIFWWDLALLILLSFTLCGALACCTWTKRQKKGWKRKGIVQLLGTLSFLCFLVLIYGSFIEPRIIVTTTTSISLPTKEPLKIVLLSDMHVGPYKGEWIIEEAVRRANLELPDLVLIAGDFIAGDTADLGMLAPLSGLRTTLGTYAVLGNHDIGKSSTLFGRKKTFKNRSEELRSVLESINVTVLENQNSILSFGDDTIAIAGIKDLWLEEEDLEKAFEGITDDMVTILLSHNPSIIWDNLASKAHLIVSGHTHGGQIRLPITGPVPTLPTDLGQQYDHGIFSVDEDTTLAITRGIGESGPRARLLAWPEVMLLKTQ